MSTATATATAVVAVSDEQKQTTAAIDKALNFRYGNTLHGFNAINDGGECILGIITWDRILDGEDPSYNNPCPKRPEEPPESETEALLRKRFGAESLPEDTKEKKYRFIGNCYAGSYLACPHSMRDKTGELVDFIRERGYRIQLQTKLGVVYRSADVKTNPFSKENTEREVAKDLRAILKRPGYRTGYHPVSCYQTYAMQYCDTRLWCTDEGKAVARRLKEFFPKENKENGEDEPGSPVMYGLVDGELKQRAHDFPLVGTYIKSEKAAIDTKSSGDKRKARDAPVPPAPKKKRVVPSIVECSRCNGTGCVEGEINSDGEEVSVDSDLDSFVACSACDASGRRPLEVGHACNCGSSLRAQELGLEGLCFECHWRKHKLCCLCGDKPCKDSLDRVTENQKRSASDVYIYCVDCYDPLR